MKKNKKLFVLVLFMILFLSFQNSHAADQPKVESCTARSCQIPRSGGTTARQAASPVVQTAQVNPAAQQASPQTVGSSAGVVTSAQTITGPGGRITYTTSYDTSTGREINGYVGEPMEQALGIVQSTTDNAQVQSRLGEINALRGEASRRFTQMFGTVGQDGTVGANMANIQKAGEVLQDPKEQAAWKRAAQLSFTGQLRQISGQIIGKDNSRLDFTLRRTENGWTFTSPGGNADETQQFLNFVRGAGTNAVPGFEGNRNPVVQLSGLSFDGVQDGEVSGYKTSMSELLKYVPTEETFRNAVTVNASPAAGSTGPSPAKPSIQPGQPATTGASPAAETQPPPATQLIPPTTPSTSVIPATKPTVVAPPTVPITPITPAAAQKITPQDKFVEKTEAAWKAWDGVLKEKMVASIPMVDSHSGTIYFTITGKDNSGQEQTYKFLLPNISEDVAVQKKYAEAFQKEWQQQTAEMKNIKAGGLIGFSDGRIHIGILGDYADGRSGTLGKAYSFPKIDTFLSE